MIKIKRKVVLHGQSTLTVSLPSAWARKFNINKGDELEVKEYHKELRISTEKAFGLDTKQIDIGNLKRLGKSYITALYRTGFDEIHVNYNDNGYIGVIQDLISKETTGFEIIRQNPNYCLIKDLTGYIEGEFDNVLRRIWLLTLDMSKEALDAVSKKDVNALKHIQLMDYSINKFSNYCLRLLIKRGHVDFKKTPFYYHLIKSLEEITDDYKDLCNFYLNCDCKVDNKTITHFNKINDYLNEFYGLFYKYDEEKIDDLFRRSGESQDRISKSESCLAYMLFSICKDIRNLLSTLVEINL